MLRAGSQFWAAGESNYWATTHPGLQPCASLHAARLPGKPPWVERFSAMTSSKPRSCVAGLRSPPAPELIGSGEDMPGERHRLPARDRRWDPGNLSMPRAGISRPATLSRVHFLTASCLRELAMWLALLLVSSLVSPSDTRGRIFPARPHTLPQWPQSRRRAACTVCVTTGSGLLRRFRRVPGTADRHLRGQLAAPHGCASACSSSILSVLLAPSMMLFHSTFVAHDPARQAVSWKCPGPQRPGRHVARSLPAAENGTWASVWRGARSCCGWRHTFSGG